MDLIIDAAVELETCTFEVGRLGDLLEILHEMIDIVREQSTKNIVVSAGRMDLMDAQLATVERLNRDIRKSIKYWSDRFYDCSRQLKERDRHLEDASEEESCKQQIKQLVEGIQSMNHLKIVLAFARTIDEAEAKEKASAGVGAHTGAQDKYQLS